MSFREGELDVKGDEELGEFLTGIFDENKNENDEHGVHIQRSREVVVHGEVKRLRLNEYVPIGHFNDIETTLANIGAYDGVTLELSNRVLDLMLAKRGSVRKQLDTTKRKRVYKPFLVRLDELLADGRVLWKTESIFTVTKTTVLSHFSDLSKPTYAFKRAMKSHGFTLHERSTNKLFYFEHKNFKKSSRGMLSEFSTIM